MRAGGPAVMGDDVSETSSVRGMRRDLLAIVVPSVLMIVVGIWIALQFAEPAPPKRITITTGGESGAYFGFGKRYAEHLARSGIQLEVRSSKGSIENLARLNDPWSGVAVGLLQGGIVDAKSGAGLVSIGRVFLEPLWIFYRAPQAVDRMSELKGKRIAVGPEGSGTRHLALALLEANAISAANATLLVESGKAAADALLAGRADAIFLALAPEAQVVQDLLRRSDVKLMSLTQAEAYTRLFPYLSRIVLPQGAIDLVRDIPSSDIQLVAPVAALVARETLHPALVSLLVEAASEVHGGAGLFHKLAEFPRTADPELPMSADALRVYKNGPSFLKRYLPFWLATFLERMLVIAIPVATVLFPIFKLAPWLYQWRIKRRINYWYGQLKALERRIAAKGDASDPDFRMEMARIDDAVSNIPVPVNFSEQYYTLRSAVDLVRSRMGMRPAG